MHTDPTDLPATSVAEQCWAKPVASVGDLMLRAVIALEWNCPGEAADLAEVDMPPPEVIVDALTTSDCMSDRALGHLVRGVFEYCSLRGVEQ